jgi:isopentenyldiphosphate isomerase
MINKVKVNLTGYEVMDRGILLKHFNKQADLIGVTEEIGVEFYAKEMLCKDLEYAVQYFNGWFGEEVDLVLPERRIEEDRQLREAQDDIDKADWT